MHIFLSATLLRGVVWTYYSGSRSTGITCRVGKGALFARRAHRGNAVVGTLRFAHPTTFPYDRKPL